VKVPYRALPHVTDADIDRFWSRVEKAGETECWLWTGARTRYGYGQMRVSGQTVYVNRLSLYLHTQQDYVTLVARHQCDNPPCVNPLHLAWGSTLDNRLDCVKRGRTNLKGANRGEANHLAKLTAEDVRVILRCEESGVEMAKRFNVDQSTISKVRNRHCWTHVSA
jgi:hypothetical protein